MSTFVCIDQNIATLECGTQLEVSVELLLAAPELLRVIKECDAFFCRAGSLHADSPAKQVRQVVETLRGGDQ